MERSGGPMRFYNVGLALFLVACGSSGDDTTEPGPVDTGSGGATDAGGTGGAKATGGSTGTGGASGTGGAKATGGSTGTGGSSPSDSGSTDAQKDTGPTDAQAGYNPCPAKGTPCAIMALGDSITDGVGGSGGSYRPALFHLALTHSQTITFVGSGSNGPNTVDGVTFPKGHEGHSGYTIDDGGGRTGIHSLTAPAMNTYHPNIITLMIGTNDVNINLDLANAPARLGGLMDTILTTDPNVLLVVAQMVPTTDDGTNVRVKAYNDAIPALVKTRADVGKHVIMVDMYGAFTADTNYKTDYMNDTLHPKDAGYVKMADVWYAAIGSLFR